MSKFKIGDRVRVSTGFGWEREGDLGIVEHVELTATTSEPERCFVRFSDGEKEWYNVDHISLAVTDDLEQKPIDLDAIQVGDEVLIRVQVVRNDSTDANLPLMVNANGLSRIWVPVDSIAAHIPKPPVPPATLAEFKAMPEALQARVYAELLKKGGG